MENNRELQGLGGWLILVGIGVVMSPFRLLVNLVSTYKPVFENVTWEDLTTEGAEFYVPYLSSLLVGEITFNVIMFVASIILVYLFFSKHYLFPKLYIGTLVAYLIFIPLDAWVVTKIFPDTEIFDPETIKNFSRAIAVGIVWVPYMLLSKRVKATFVENLPRKEAQPTTESIG